ncbi:MAG: acyloxyacyl hydrolase [Bacteroidia bacterium]|nr:acyloxyacyl hydrolase [Bacteroidia bacterium]
MKKVKIIITILSFFVLRMFSQSIYNLGAAYEYGFNFNNASEREFGNTVPSGCELSFYKQRKGDQYWEKIFNYPQTGWSLSFIDHRNKYLGSTIALNRFMNYVFARKKKVESFVRLSAGFFYATKIYKKNDHANENYNNSISQHLSFSGELGLGITVYPTSKLSFNLEVTGMHYSNGGMSQPNNGLNLVMFKAGAGYIIGDKKNLVYKNPDAEEDDRGIRYNISLGTGIKQIDNDNEEKYRLFTISSYVDKKISRVNAINAGVDVFVNRAVEYIIENSAEHRGKDFKRVGISAGHEFFIGKVGVLTQFGYHVYAPYPAFSDFYQKLGIKYYFNELFFAAVNLRVFKLEISDEINWGIGVRL